MLFLPDLRGHGASHARQQVSSDGIGSDLIALLAHEGAHEATLVGHCLGANLAVRVWERCPEWVGRLVFIEPFVTSSIRPGLAFIRVLLWPVLLSLLGMAKMVNAMGIGRSQFRTIDFEIYDDWVRPRLTSFWTAVRYMGPWVDLWTMPVASYLQALRILFAYHPPWESIGCPTLAIYGKKAELAAADRPEPLSANPKVQSVVLEAGHFVLTDNMEGVAKAIERFVKRTHNSPAEAYSDQSSASS